MSGILPIYLVLAALYVAAVAIVCASVWRGDRRWLRALAALAGAAAIWMPLLIKSSSLGEPNPSPPDKVLRLLSVFDDGARNLYLFVDTEPNEYAPRIYRVKQVKHKYDDGLFHVQQMSYSGLQGVRVNVDSEGGGGELVYLDYEPPDWDKGNMQRGWREQRPRE